MNDRIMLEVHNVRRNAIIKAIRAIRRAIEVNIQMDELDRAKESMNLAMIREKREYQNMKTNERIFKAGDQIAYIPDHAEGDILHDDVEFGFVTSQAGKRSVFCRYWIKGLPGVLRTVANSEATPIENLVEHKSVHQWIVEETIKRVLE